MSSGQEMNYERFNGRLFIALMACTILTSLTSTAAIAQESSDDSTNIILYDSSSDFTSDFIFKFGDEVFVEEEPEEVAEEEPETPDEPDDPDPTPVISSYGITYDISTWTHYLSSGSLTPVDLGQATPVETITITGSPSLPLTCEFLTPAIDVPEGITLDSTTCELSGHPTELGTWNVSIALRNSLGTASTPANMEIVALPDPTPDPSSYDITYDISTWNHYLSDDGLTSFDHGQPQPVETITIVGSPSLPLTCEFITPVIDVPEGITLNSTTCELSGSPTEIGTWNVSIALRNSLGTASTPANMEIVAAASGDIQLISGGDSDTLRIFEPFETDAIEVSGAIGEVTFAPSRSVIADGVNVSAADGAINPGSYINTADSNYEFTIDATDEAGRTFETSPTYSYNVVDSFIFTNNAANNSAAALITTDETSKSVTIDFNTATYTNQMGDDIRFDVRGNYPGNVYTGYYDPDFYGPGSGENVFSYDDNGTAIVTADTPADGNIILYPDAGYLEIDMTQAQVGTHTFELVAIDNYIDGYTEPTETQIAPNEDGETITLSLTQKANTLPDETGYIPPTMTTCMRFIGLRFGCHSWSSLGLDWGQNNFTPTSGTTEPGYRFWRITGRQNSARQGTEIKFWGPNIGDDRYTYDVPFQVSFGDNQNSRDLVTGLGYLFDGITDGSTKTYTDAQFSNQFVFEFATPIQPYKVSMGGQGVTADTDSLYDDSTVGQLEYSEDGITWYGVVEQNSIYFDDQAPSGETPSYEYWYEMEFNLVY